MGQARWAGSLYLRFITSVPAIGPSIDQRLIDYCRSRQLNNKLIDTLCNATMRFVHCRYLNCFNNRFIIDKRSSYEHER